MRVWPDAWQVDQIGGLSRSDTLSLQTVYAAIWAIVIIVLLVGPIRCIWVRANPQKFLAEAVGEAEAAQVDFQRRRRLKAPSTRSDDSALSASLDHA